MADYAIDPEFSDLLAALPAARDLTTVEGIVSARENFLTPPSEAHPDVVRSDATIPGPADNPEVPVRIYRPAAPADAPRGGLLYIHGGGFFLGSIAMSDGGCDAYARGADIVVVSVEYRLAPEDPYPAGVEDCYAALVWMAQNAEELGVDPARIGVGGGSAGGGLSAGVALLARDRGGPDLSFQLLQIPELDDRLETESMKAFTDTPMWNRPNAESSWKHYLGDLHGTADIPIYAAPARCEDLAGLPRAYVSTMEFDPLRDEGILYALGMMHAGVSVELHAFAGTFHGSSMEPRAAVSQREAAETITVLRRALGSG